MLGFVCEQLQNIAEKVKSTRPIFTKYSYEHSKFESNTTLDLAN